MTAQRPMTREEIIEDAKARGFNMIYFFGSSLTMENPIPVYLNTDLPERTEEMVEFHTVRGLKLIEGVVL